MSSEMYPAAVRAIAESRELGLGKLAQPLRAAVSGSTTSPGIFEVLEQLGREESLGRIADAIEQGLSSKGVVVVIEARHHCVVSRGARQPEANTVTMSARGCYSEPAARAEVMALIAK